MKRENTLLWKRLPHLTWDFEANHKSLPPEFLEIAIDDREGGVRTRFPTRLLAAVLY
jgi:hypothetical protein